jgi:hypothetical protein
VRVNYLYVITNICDFFPNGGLRAAATAKSSKMIGKNLRPTLTEWASTEWPAPKSPRGYDTNELATHHKRWAALKGEIIANKTAQRRIYVAASLGLINGIRPNGEEYYWHRPKG